MDVRLKNSKQISPVRMAERAGEAAALMKAMSNEHRLLILCHLIAEEEMSVGELVSRIGLSQSALSQHLAKLRGDGLLAFRREGQTIFYRVCDERAANVLQLLHEIYCHSPGGRRRQSLAPSHETRRNRSVAGG